MIKLRLMMSALFSHKNSAFYYVTSRCQALVARKAQCCDESRAWGCSFKWTVVTASDWLAIECCCRVVRTKWKTLTSNRTFQSQSVNYFISQELLAKQCTQLHSTTGCNATFRDIKEIQSVNHEFRLESENYIISNVFVELIWFRWATYS